MPKKKIKSIEEAAQLADLYMSRGKYRSAELIYRQLLKYEPHKLLYNSGLAESLFRQLKVEESLATFQKLLDELNPTNDKDYDALYVQALRATLSSPAPLHRMLRFYELVRQLSFTLALEGDVVECGCFRGLSSYLMCNYLKRHDAGFTGKGYHIFDSFRGLSEPSIEDDIPAGHANAESLAVMSQKGAFAASLKHVQHNLKAFPEIEFHPGWIPASFAGLPERTYKFVHVDVDLYDPTLACVEFFYPRLTRGGLLVSDDYSWPGACKAIDEFCAERKIEFAVTPYKQAILTAG